LTTQSEAIRKREARYSLNSHRIIQDNPQGEEMTAEWILYGNATHCDEMR
jgi:hypothetical protein